MIPNHLRYICSVDPITLTGLALAGLAGGGAAAATGALGGSAPTPQVPAPAAPPPPAQSPQTKTTTPAGNQPTFIGAAATPPTQSGQKTLLGQ